ncbi:MAG: DEAD/DEAH box helicase [Nanoarchaeota archaeon]
MSQIKFQPREYQNNIVETAKEKNTLVILPTGLGKTAISIILTLERLAKFPESKAIIVAPTKPLCKQHLDSFQEQTDFPKNKIVLVTGLISPKKRQLLYREAKIIIATPQTIDSDIKNQRINLENISALTIDECHRSREKYANTIVAQHYIKQSHYPRILALTASPGSTKERIDEIQKNLFIESIEIRDEESEDVKEYVQKRNIEFIEVELPENFKEIHKLVQEVYKQKVKQLANFGLTKPSSIVNKTDIILFQKNLQSQIRRGNRGAFWGISLAAQALKLTHSLELLETQGLNSFYSFITKLEKETTKAAKIISNDKKIQKSIKLANILRERNIEHPKMDKLNEIIQTQFKKTPNSKTIIFANYRDTVKRIVNLLSKIENVKPIGLMGQKEGITQKKQLETLSKFGEGKYNIICTTSIGEEGLDIPGGLTTALFYDQAASAIRKIQRSGRVGRTEPGKIIYLITKNTRDQAYHWKSHRDVKKMQNIVSGMQKRLEKQSKL